MRKRFAPLALLFGLLTALMLGSTAVAQAHPAGDPHKGFNCNNVGVNLVTCSHVLNDAIKVNIEDNDTRVLTDNELKILEDTLNIEIDIKNVDVNLLKEVVVKTYALFNIPITVDDVKVCILAVCK